MMKNKTTVRSVKMKTKSKNFVINYLRTNEYPIGRLVLPFEVVVCACEVVELVSQ